MLGEVVRDAAPPHDDRVEVAIGHGHVLVLAVDALGVAVQRTVELLLRGTRRPAVLFRLLVCAVAAGTVVVAVALIVLLIARRRVTLLIRLGLVTAAVATVALLIRLTLIAGIAPVGIHLAVAVAVITLASLLLLATVVLLAVLPHITDDGHDIIEGLGSVDAVDVLLLVGREGDARLLAGADLVVQVDAVDERQSVHVLAGDTEEVMIHHVLIRLEEVAAHTGELALHHAFDTRVFHDVEHDLSHLGLLRHAGDLLGSGTPRALDLLIAFVVRREQSVADFVTDEHIVDLVGHVDPHGQREDAIHDIHAGGRGRGVVTNGQVLTCENARQHIFGAVANG